MQQLVLLLFVHGIESWFYFVAWLLLEITYKVDFWVAGQWNKGEAWRTWIETECLCIFIQLLGLLAGRGGPSLLAATLPCCGRLFMACWRYTSYCYGWWFLVCKAYLKNTDRDVGVGLQWSFLWKWVGLERPAIICLAKNAFSANVLQWQAHIGYQAIELKGFCKWFKRDDEKFWWSIPGTWNLMDNCEFFNVNCWGWRDPPP